MFVDVWSRGENLRITATTTWPITNHIMYPAKKLSMLDAVSKKIKLLMLQVIPADAGQLSEIPGQLSLPSLQSR